jgi:hypothetical protein
LKPRPDDDAADEGDEPHDANPGGDRAEHRSDLAPRGRRFRRGCGTRILHRDGGDRDLSNGGEHRRRGDRDRRCGVPDCGLHSLGGLRRELHDSKHASRAEVHECCLDVLDRQFALEARLEQRPLLPEQLDDFLIGDRLADVSPPSAREDRQHPHRTRAYRGDPIGPAGSPLRLRTAWHQGSSTALEISTLSATASVPKRTTTSSDDPEPPFAGARELGSPSRRDVLVEVAIVLPNEEVTAVAGGLERGASGALELAPCGASVRSRSARHAPARDDRQEVRFAPLLLEEDERERRGAFDIPFGPRRDHAWVWGDRAPRHCARWGRANGRSARRVRGEADEARVADPASVRVGLNNAERAAPRLSTQHALHGYQSVVLRVAENEAAIPPHPAQIRGQWVVGDPVHAPVGAPKPR